MKDAASLRDMRRRKDLQRSAEKSARTNEGLKDALTDMQQKDYTNTLEDIQASGELNAEISEQSLGEHRKQSTEISEQTRSLKDIVAAGELVAENTEISNQRLADINNTLTDGFERISEFAQQLKENFSAQLPAVPIPPSPSTETEEVIPDEEPANQPALSIGDYLKKISDGIVSFIKPKKEEDKPKPTSEEEHREAALQLVLDRLDSIAKVASKGFNKTINIADDIASMLFKYTVSALINTAKMAALLFALVLGVDILMIHFRHWSKLMETNFGEFESKLGSLSEPMQDSLTALKNMAGYWQNGEYGKLVDEIGSSVAGASKYLFDMLLLGMGKGTAALLRALGANEAADDLEVAAIMRANAEAGYQLSEDEEKLVDDVYERRNKNAVEEIQTKRDRIGGGFNYSVMGTSDEQRKKDNETLKEAKKTGQQERIGQQTENELNRLQKNITDNQFNPKVNDQYGKKLDELNLEIDKNLSEGKLMNEQASALKSKKAELKQSQQAQYKVISGNAPQAKPAAPESAPDSDMGKVANIEKAEKAKTSAPVQSTNVNQTNSVVKQNNQTFVMAPQTRQDAPGLGNKL